MIVSVILALFPLKLDVILDAVNVAHLTILNPRGQKVKNNMGCSCYLRTLRKGGTAAKNVAAVSLVFYSCALVFLVAFPMIVKGDRKDEV